MANLNNEQQDGLWDNRFESIKVYNNDTIQDASTFECYRFASTLDGHNYYVVIEAGNGVSHSTAASTVETKVKEQLALMEYKEPVGHSTTIV